MLQRLNRHSPLPVLYYYYMYSAIICQWIFKNWIESALFKYNMYKKIFHAEHRKSWPEGTKKPRRKACSQKSGSAFCRGLGCPQQAKREHRKVGDAWLRISKRIFLVIACRSYQNIPITPVIGTKNNRNFEQKLLNSENLSQIVPIIILKKTINKHRQQLEKSKKFR